VPLYYVTVSYGQTTITSANIATATGAPFISATLPQIAQSAIGLASLVETIAGTITNKAVTPAGPRSGDTGGSYHFAADTGAVNALSISMTPAPTGYTTGMSITVRAANTTTGAATMNVNGLGARAITFAGSPLQPGAMVAGQIYTLVYDGTAFQLGSGSRNAGHHGVLIRLNGRLYPVVERLQDPGSAADVLGEFVPDFQLYVCVQQ
jgi:hypothetical protein